MLWWERVAPFGFPVVPWNRENQQRDSIWIIVRSALISHNHKGLTGEGRKTLIISLQSNVPLGNLWSWHSCGCHFTCTNHSTLNQASMEAEHWIGLASDMSMETGPLVVSEKVLDPSSRIHEDRRTPPEVLCLKAAWALCQVLLCWSWSNSVSLESFGGPS